MAKEKKTSGWKDPVRRPRYIIWSAVIVLALAAFIIVAFGATSTFWFCGSFCHSIQGDAVNAYSNGSHNRVSCLSCHEPVNGGPFIFTYNKAYAGIDGAIRLAIKHYSSPLNPVDELALNKKEMSSDHCTQCHNLDNRKVTPSAGIVINHSAHSDKDIQCTVCHNRVAHPEADIQVIAKNPKTGETAAKHADFMTMTACFRCHTLTETSPSGAEYKAPGKCSTCHPANFQLKPSNHKVAGFFPKGHAKLAMMQVDQVTGRPSENIVRPVEYGEPAASESAESKATQTTKEEAKETESYAGKAKTDVYELVKVQDVDYCSTCHVKAKFCDGCHGMPLPHPEEFKTKTHPALAKTAYAKCVMCHQPDKTHFCSNCHHGTKVNWKFDANTPWKTQHAKAVSANGVASCLGACHDKKFCVDCHTKLKPVPTSHKAADWLHNKLTVTVYPDTHAVPTAAHALAAAKSVDACDVCHGPGGIKAQFCVNCHKIDMPHPDQFKKQHVSGRDTPAICANCHQQKELCSDCHHQGAKNGVPWVKEHPNTVDKNGAASCFVKCHSDKKFCVDCHMKLKALPTSHKAKDWTHRVSANKPAGHQVAYKAASDSCDFCHGTGGVKAAFCVNCHKLEMPHPSGYKDLHKDLFKTGKVTKAVCMNCHQQFFCDSCHHQGAVATAPWLHYHPNIVKKTGAEPCFKCHAETFCSHCHVNLGARP